eukprot:m.114018 g.114018  ORF g.114018 m.114018 type:complete len:194 (+) comp19338_c0_seq1:45-626(+)
MYGELAIEILQELKRCSPNTLPPFNEDKLRRVILEIRALYDEVKRTIGEKREQLKDPPVHGCMLVQFESIKRNKRCMLAYLKERMSRMQRLRWEAGAVLTPEWRDNLSAAEVGYFSEYNKLLNKYMQGFDPLELTMDLQPPKEPKIEVRVLQEYGEITTSNGDVINLNLGSQQYMRRVDAEPLIRQGILEHIL